MKFSSEAGALAKGDGPLRSSRCGSSPPYAAG
jgi:hypothetical protein